MKWTNLLGEQYSDTEGHQIVELRLMMEPRTEPTIEMKTVSTIFILSAYL